MSERKKILCGLLFPPFSMIKVVFFDFTISFKRTLKKQHEELEETTVIRPKCITPGIYFYSPMTYVMQVQRNDLSGEGLTCFGFQESGENEVMNIENL